MFGFALTAAPSPAQAPKINVDVAGVQFVKREKGKGFEGVRPFNSQNLGVKLSLFIEPEGSAKIIEIDDDESKLASFKDDQGTDLLEKADKENYSRVGFSFMNEVSDDGAVGMIDLESGRGPADGAKTVSAEGAVSVHLGSKTAQHKIDGALKEGAALKGGPFSFVVKSVGKDKNFDDEAIVAINIETKTKPTTLAKVRFLDKSGKDLESSRTGSSSMSFGNQGTFTFDYEIKTADAANVATVVFEEWTDFQKVMVPFVAEAAVWTASKTGAAKAVE
ncbi:MAG: hypothetical protein R3F11_31850 [Verrucomicrobiales bacterium]